jgi:hypothetical protein
VGGSQLLGVPALDVGIEGEETPEGTGAKTKGMLSNPTLTWLQNETAACPVGPTPTSSPFAFSITNRSS